MIDTRRVTVFLAVTFVFTWGIHALIWATGGLAGDEIVAGVPLSLPLILVSMFGPAVGNIVTRLVTREGWEDLRLGFSGPVRAWLVVWPGIVVAAVVGAVAYFAAFPGDFDPSMPLLQEQLDEAADQARRELPLPVGVLAALQVVAAIVFAPFVNTIPAFGEEFGWRGYLQWKLRPLGWRPMVLWMGLIWGVWHWPLIALGYNYGTGYPGAPWTGMAVFVVFTTAVGAVLAWATESTDSVWPAAFGHGVVNAIAGLGALFAVGGVAPLLGPTSVGLLGGLGFVVLALVVARRPPVRAIAEAGTDAS